MTLRVQLILTVSVIITASQEIGFWGPWGEYSGCSRTCGGGVRSRSRRCITSRVKECTGDSVMYESCHTQSCPVESVDFREYQCNFFSRGNDKWSAHYNTSFPCSLYCENQLGRVDKLRNVVTDGTACDRAHTFGLCVAGVCKHVGCDHIIGSAKTLDNCLVCGGRGDKCETISGSSPASLKVGELTEIATFPIGTTSFQINASSRESINIELHAAEGMVLDISRYIGGHTTKTLEFSGAIGDLRVTDFGFVLKARGPLNQTLHLKVQSKGRSMVVQYEYSIPANRILQKNPEMRYSWSDSNWTPCSVTCGVGYQKRSVVCIDRSTGQVVENKQCPEEDMPAARMACNKSPCRQTLLEKYKWIPGQFSDCNTYCGAGYETQLMFCLKTDMNEETGYVTDAECEASIGQKPLIRRACFGSETKCGRWVIGDWSQCSATCGGGRQTRSVTCEKMIYDEEDEDGRSAPAEDESLCPQESRPRPEQPCHVRDCGSSGEEDLLPSEDCRFSRYGCCPDQVTAAKGEHNLGCSDCINTGVST